MAARLDRAHGGGAGVRRQGLYTARLGRGICKAFPPLRHATHATPDGPVRYTAPSVVFEHAGRRLEAGGWQTIEAYDVLVANLIPDGERRGVPDDPLALLTSFPYGLVTQEAAQLLTRGNDAPDRIEAEASMLRL